jgi:hypothetical protein
VTPEELFSVWAPSGAIWSPWVKPVLFAHAASFVAAGKATPFEFDLSWLPTNRTNGAIVVDLPGSDGVWLGLALARIGYRPIPLYNAAPAPERDLSLVPIGPILAAIIAATPELAKLNLPANAPPAFLLDANRRGGMEAAEPGRFDNRSISFPTDFPSANLLLHRGIHSAVLVTETGGPPQPDLAHTLRRWQEAGIILAAKRLNTSNPPEPLIVQRPTWYRWLWYRLAMLARLRRNPLGGFGGTISESAGG